MSNNKWGREVQKRAFNSWIEHFEEYCEGIQPFTSPIPESASVIVMGYNPGETDDGDIPSMTEQFLRGDFSMPERGDYGPPSKVETGYKAAKPLREHLFKNHLSYLDGDCVETNLYHLRTKGTDSHKKFDGLSEDIWNNYIKFCYSTLDELISRVEPKLLVVFSMTAYNDLVERAENVSVEEKHKGLWRGSNIQALTHSKLDGLPVVATAHPSTCWQGEVKERVRNRGPELLSKYLD